MKILQAIDELPPKDIDCLRTVEQQAYWFEVKEKFEILHIFFEAYFSGNPIPFSILGGVSQKFYFAKFWQMLAFYNLLQQGWEYILKEAENTSSVKFTYANPGECFIAYFKAQAEGQIHMCKLGRFDIRPRYRNKMRRLAQKIDDNKANKIDKINFNKHIKDLKNLGFDQFVKLEFFCIKACKKHSKTDDALGKILQEYLEKFEEVESVKKSIDRNRAGYAWENGKILTTQKEGGTYTQENS